MKKIIYFLSIVLVMSCSSDRGNESEPKIVLPVATCTDGFQNGNETGVDCGGSSCAACPEVTATIPTSGYSSPNSYSGYNLVWSDEFNSDTLDTSKWGFHLASGCPNLCGWGNNELQYYTNKNHSFKDGNLIIKAKKEKISGFDYSSTRINTDNKFEFKYGRIDIRACMPSATGTWVAFWLLNKDYQVQNPAAEWPSGGEIDIMEYLGQKNNEILGTPHYGSNLASHKFNSTYYTAPSGSFDTVYYVYSLIWEEDKITWLVNNVEYKTFTPSNTGGQPYPFNDEFYLMMNLSVGGNLPVAPVVSQYPAFVIIDYIRVFQPE
jgi:beta-glucanase (GH16 family)